MTVVSILGRCSHKTPSTSPIVIERDRVGSLCVRQESADIVESEPLQAAITSRCGYANGGDRCVKYLVNFGCLIDDRYSLTQTAIFSHARDWLVKHSIRAWLIIPKAVRLLNYPTRPILV